MLGGLTTGAGSQLVLADVPPIDHDGVIAIPMDPTQHTMDAAERETDVARQDHSASEPP
jgi:hypothetical protein